MKINLTEKPEIVQSPPRQYLYVEKIGPFMVQARKAWDEFSSIVEPHKSALSMSGMAGLSKIDNSKQGDDRFVYQAGVFVDAAPALVPTGLKLRTSPSGRYARFTLTGSYHQLEHAYPQIFSILEKDGISLRDEFCAEVYLNTPENTPEENLKTDILIPIQ